MIVFEAVARHLSFTKAADELRVSQAAVSRQVGIIEEHLGVRLFERRHRSIELTPQGVHLIGAVSMALGHVANVSDSVRRQIGEADITISSSVSFASYWLMSRIAKFRAEFPKINVRLVAYATVRDLTVSALDFAVRYGRGTWEGATADLMFGNEIFPVCSPAYIVKHGAMNSPAGLSAATLLTLSRFDRNWTTWEEWFERQGTPLPNDVRWLPFDSYLLLLNATVRGDGVALCGQRLAEDLIDNGELVRPINASVNSEHSFFLLRPENAILRPAQAHFRDWLLQEARGQ